MPIPDLERYTVHGELGHGGMSVVYRARDQQLSRDVALKVLHEFLAKQPDARRRFHREAVAVAKLHHPGILEIFDYSGPDAEPAYIVTELIEGKTLREFVEKHGHPQHPEVAILVISELTRALRHAHEQGIIHRDLKPENVMITNSGQLKLMDFGIAQIMGGATKLTATGTLLGSPAHMAPEVIDGVPSDHRCDIFSIGTILYWLACGQLPFEAPNPSALFRRILDGNYEHPQMLAPRIGNGLARIIEQALALDLEARYQDVSELQEDLLYELEAVDLELPEVQAKRYLSDPQGYEEALTPRLIERLAKVGQAALHEGNIATATDRFNRVLAIDPEHKEVLAIVASMGRKATLRKRTRQAFLGLGLAGALGGVSYGGTTLLQKVEANAKTRSPPERAAPPSGGVQLASRTLMVPEPGIPTSVMRPTPTTPEKTPEQRPVKKPVIAEPRPRVVKARLQPKVRPRLTKSSPRPKPSATVKPAGATETKAANPGAEKKPNPSEAPDLRAKLTVKVNTWSDVFLDDRRVAKETMKPVSLALVPGRHVLIARKKGYPIDRKELVVTEKGAVFVIQGANKRKHPPSTPLQLFIPNTRLR